jgi:hypothetical protein
LARKRLELRESVEKNLRWGGNVSGKGRDTGGDEASGSGAYAQLRMDYRFDAHLTGALEAVHYKIGDTIRQAGGHDSNYLGLELKYSL